MDRRHFLSSSILLGSIALPNDTALNDKMEIQENINLLPHFCSHEHWGSIFSIGAEQGGFRADFIAGATPLRQTTLADLIIDPYMAGNLQAEGMNPWEIEENRGKKTDIFQLMLDSPRKAIYQLDKLLKNQRLTGTYLCMRQGILCCYNSDIENCDTVLLGDVLSIQNMDRDTLLWIARGFLHENAQNLYLQR